MIEDVVQHQYKTFTTNENKVDAALSLLFWGLRGNCRHLEDTKKEEKCEDNTALLILHKSVPADKFSNVAVFLSLFR